MPFPTCNVTEACTETVTHIVRTNSSRKNRVVACTGHTRSILTGLEDRLRAVPIEECDHPFTHAERGGVFRCDDCGHCEEWM